MALSALVVSSPAFAQDDEDAVSDEILVQGFRRSIQNSQQIKREADNFKDAVSAEDIGALPDRSVLEALQRVPGISISRFAAGNDPDHFSVEGSGVVVRGLNYVRSELNGRDTFSANNGRALSFSDVPPELLQSVEVSKNNSADMIEGGLAGTVNLVTRKPFDAQGRVIAGSVEVNYGDFRKEWSPTASALISDRWDTDVGEFGLLINGVYSKLKTRSDGIQASNFGCRDTIGGVDYNATTCDTLAQEGIQGVFFPRGGAFRSQDTDRERIGYAAAAQWANPSDTLLATFQFLRSESSVSWTETGSEIATDVVRDQGDSMPVAGTVFDFDDDGIFTRGVITGNAGWGDDRFNGEARTPKVGLQSNNLRRDVEQEYVTSDYGFNLRWTPTDRLRVNLDAQHIRSRVENLDVSFWTSSFHNVSMDLTGDLPDIRFMPPSLDGMGPSDLCGDDVFADCSTYNSVPYGDAAQYFWRSAMDHYEDSEGQEWAFRGDVEYDVDAGWFQGVRMGARYSERDQTTRWSTYNWGVTSEMWGSGGPVWINDPVDGVPQPGGVAGTTGQASTDLMYQEFFENFFRGRTALPTEGIGLWTWAGNTAQDYNDFATWATLVGNEWRPARDDAGNQQNWVPLWQRDNVVAGTAFLPNEINDTLEKVWSFYAMAKFGGELPNGMDFNGNAGVRYVRTNNTANGSIGFPQPSDLPDESQCFPPDDLAPGQPWSPPAFCDLSVAERLAARAFANGASVADDGFTKYDHVLPSVNAKLNLTDDFLIRFGWSTSIARPELGLTRNFITIVPWQDDLDGDGDDEFIGFQVTNSGNPHLRPVKSKQFDLSFEWYFAEVGSLTLSMFTKTLEGVHTNGFRTETLTNNGETFPVRIISPANAEDNGRIRGIELAHQQFYDFLPTPLDGFGTQFNYTYIDSDGVAQQNVDSNNPDGGVSDPNAAGNGANFIIDTSRLPLEGLSTHNINAAAIYEKGRLSARIAYNWRSRYLLTVRDVIVPHAPIFNDATGQLDGSIFYNLTDQVKVGVQAVNILDEVTKTSQVLNNNGVSVGRSWFLNDRRVTFIVRGTF